MENSSSSRTTNLLGNFDLQFWGKTHRDLIDEKEYRGGFFSFSEDSFSVDAPVYDNSRDAAYENTEGNFKSAWIVPADDTLISLGTLTYRNDTLANDFASDARHGANFKLTLNDPVEGTFASNFYIHIINNRNGAENIRIGGKPGVPKKLQLRDPNGRPLPIFLDYVGAREIGASEDTPLKYSFDVPDSTTTQFQLFGRLFTTEDFPDPVRITSISEDTGIEGDFRTSDTTLVFYGKAAASNKVEVFLDDTSIGTTTADASGNWSYDYTETVLLEGEYQVSAKDTFTSSAPKELTIDTTAPDIKITSISEDTGVKGDFRTSDNTLIFNGTTEAGSEVELFVDNKSIGTTTANAQGDWSYNYTNFKFADGEYKLTATATDLVGNSASTNQTQLLEIEEPTLVISFKGFLGSSGKAEDKTQHQLDIGNNGGTRPGVSNFLRKRFSEEELITRNFGPFQVQKAFDFITGFSSDSPLILIGHSFGADSVVELANKFLSENRNVDLTIQLDSVGAFDEVLPTNVKNGINYWQHLPSPILSFPDIEGASYVNGAINVNAEKFLGVDYGVITHTSIDEDLRDIVVEDITTFIEQGVVSRQPVEGPYPFPIPPIDLPPTPVPVPAPTPNM